MVGCRRVAKAADCKSATLETAQVRVLPQPPFRIHRSSARTADCRSAEASSTLAGSEFQCLIRIEAVPGFLRPVKQGQYLHEVPSERHQQQTLLLSTIQGNQLNWQSASNYARDAGSNPVTACLASLKDPRSNALMVYIGSTPIQITWSWLSGLGFLFSLGEVAEME